MDYQVMPPLSADEFSALKADIKARGVQVPIEYDESGNVLDGHHRIKAVEQLKAEGAEIPAPPRIIRKGLSEPEKRAHARTLNLARRHLDQAQKRAAIAAQIKDTPERSDRQIAVELGVDHKTVGAQRAELVNGGEIPHHATTTGKDGVTQPRAKAKAVFVSTDVVEKASTLPEKQQQEVLDGNKTLKEAIREIRQAENSAISMIQVTEFIGLYDVAVIDPPWPMEKIQRDVRPNQVAMDYPTMSEEEMAGMSFPFADNCHVWVWTTHRFLPMGLRLLDRWGLKYVCTFTWHKPGGFQPIGLPQYNCEFAIYARKGAPKFIDTKQFNVCFDAPRGSHSEKPSEFYDVVRRVTAGKRIDIFNRRQIDGFDTWGNEAKP